MLDFDVDAFLLRPLTARVATLARSGRPAVRPTWYLWEDGAFWILTTPVNRLMGHVHRAPAVAVVVDECDVVTGAVRQVIAHGRAGILPFDVPRGRRKLVRYLGDDETRWDERFRVYLHEDPTVVWVRVTPERLAAHDLSYTPSPPAAS